MSCLNFVVVKFLYRIPLITILFPAAYGVPFVWYGSRAVDSYSGQSYEHPREWVERRILFLSSVFAMNICAYAVLSNHVHMMLHMDVKKTQL
jgi:hypothetical protein